MRSIKKLVLIGAIAFGTFAFANNPSNSNNDNLKLNQQIQKIFSNAKLELQNEFKVNVTFTINQKDEIVVLSLDKEHEQVESFIKNKLNYKKLDSKYLGKNKTFIVPVKILPQS